MFAGGLSAAGHLHAAGINGDVRTMKDPIVAEIHRYRAKQAKRFNYDIHAIGEDIRRSEAQSGGVFVTLNVRRKPAAKKTRGKAFATPK